MGKLLRVTAWVMRLIKIVRKKVNKINIDEESPTKLHVLSVQELIAAKAALKSCCAIQIEMTKSMDTDLFILALQHFIDRHGNIRSIQCDNGSNFIGAEKELKKCMNEMDNKRIGDFLLEKRADGTVWKKNPSMASHVGRVWERQISSVRTILSSLIRTHNMSHITNEIQGCYASTWCVW